MASTVLVVEDDPDSRESLSEYLVQKGYQVTQAANGREALDRLRQQDGQPSLILLDFSLPVMNGWEFRDLQVHDPRLADIPVSSSPVNPTPTTAHWRPMGIL